MPPQDVLIAVLVSSIIATTLTVVVWLGIRLLRFIKLAGPTCCANSLFPFPPRIHLIESPSADWRKPARSQARIQAVEALGFSLRKNWRIAGMENWRISTLVHEEKGLLAVVHEEMSVGTWSAFIVPAPHFSETLVYSNALDRSNILWLPPRQHRHCPAMSERDLLAQLAPDLARIPFQTTSPDDETIGPFLESLFAQATDFRIRDGFTDFEVQEAWRRMDEHADPLTAKQIHTTQSIIRETLNERILTSCISELGDQSPLPAQEWRESMPRFLVISDTTELRSLGLLPSRKRQGPGLHLPSSLVRRRLRKTRNTGNPRDSFAQLNAELPSALRYHFLGSVSSPVSADVYCGPAPMYLATPIKQTKTRKRTADQPPQLLG